MGRRKPHVVLVAHSAQGQLFGAERSFLDVVAAVDRHDFQVSCVLPSSNDVYQRAIANHISNITVFPHGMTNRTLTAEVEIARFESIFRETRPDLVYASTITLVNPLIAASRLGVAGILHVRELIDRDEWLARHLDRSSAELLNSVQTSADFIIANSEATHQLYRRPGRSFLLRNCVDVDRFDIPNRIEPGKLKIGIISNNQPKKGIEHFVKLAALAARQGTGLDWSFSSSAPIASTRQSWRGGPRTKRCFHRPYSRLDSMQSSGSCWLRPNEGRAARKRIVG